jgi:hypothetical protein
MSALLMGHARISLLLCFRSDLDIRKFLDGIYVSEKGLVVKDN